MPLYIDMEVLLWGFILALKQTRRFSSEERVPAAKRNTHINEVNF